MSAKRFFTVPPTGKLSSTHRPAAFGVPICPGLRGKPRLPKGRRVRGALVGVVSSRVAGTELSPVAKAGSTML
jgi:hypothetical protein